MSGATLSFVKTRQEAEKRARSFTYLIVFFRALYHYRRREYIYPNMRVISIANNLPPFTRTSSTSRPNIKHRFLNRNVARLGVVTSLLISSVAGATLEKPEAVQLTGSTEFEASTSMPAVIVKGKSTAVQGQLMLSRNS